MTFFETPSQVRFSRMSLTKSLILQFQALPKTTPEAAENQIWNKCYKKYSYGLKNLALEPLWRQEAAKGLPKWEGRNSPFSQNGGSVPRLTNYRAPSFRSEAHRLPKWTQNCLKYTIFEGPLHPWLQDASELKSKTMPPKSGAQSAHIPRST